jgi:methylenetetrahydrofolate reductase (NADPH)
MKGMGFAGVHIGGHGMTYDDLSILLEKGEALAPSWREYIREFDFPQPDGWYFFEKDEETGLNTEEPIDQSQDHTRGGLGYALFRLTHRMMFREKGILFQPMRAISRKVDGSRCEHGFTRLEQVMKGMTNECMHCGDCAMAELAYLCPMSQCPKGQRNGPCGGSFEGWCEVYPKEKQCIYVRVYDRLKSDGSEDQLGAYHVPPVNYDLLWTSSWLNFYLGRDHSAKRLGIAPPAKK